MKIKIIFIVLCVIVLSGCKEIGPAAFWNNFDDNHIVKDVSEQGQWGGYRLIYWKDTGRPYTAKEVIVFAALNKWEYVKTDSLKNEEVSSWIADHADSLSMHHPANYSIIRGEGVSLTFLDSNWDKNANTSGRPALGYALISADGKQLVVYHTWGE